jgi:large subunit ribosomal protein L25
MAQPAKRSTFMEETILKASERSKQRGKFREKGFVAGVIYGEGMQASNPVKFDRAALQQVLKRHGSNARVTILFNDNKTLGFIKEVQRDAISQQITHIDVQLVSKDQEVKLSVPIVFRNVEDLADRQLQLQVYKYEVPVTGRMDLMPDAIQIDVAPMNLGDSITVDDFNLDPQIKVSEKEDAVYAVINNLPVEESAEAEENPEINENAEPAAE